MRFSCTRCGGEYYTSTGSTTGGEIEHYEFTCPNCKTTLPPDVDYKWKVEEPTKAPPFIPTPTNELIQIDYHKVIERAKKIWWDRQLKYGPTNIAATGALGCFVRATDKLARLHEVYFNRSRMGHSDESIADSWLDLLNYAAMGLMCEEGTWPGAHKS